MNKAQKALDKLDKITVAENSESSELELRTEEMLQEEGKNEAVDTQSVIKALINTSFGGDNQQQMKAVQLLKGLATSDDPAANKFMKALDKFTSSLDPANFK